MSLTGTALAAAHHSIPNCTCPANKWFLGTKKAKKHDWKAHKNHQDLKKFWEQHLGKPKHLGLNWQPWLKYLWAILNRNYFEVGMSTDRVHRADLTTQCVCPISKRTYCATELLNYQVLPTADTSPQNRRGGLHVCNFIKTYFSNKQNYTNLIVSYFQVCPKINQRL